MTKFINIVFLFTFCISFSACSLFKSMFGIKDDEKTYVEQYKESCDRNSGYYSGNACYMLANIYFNPPSKETISNWDEDMAKKYGKVEKDIPKAIELYEKACKLGEDSACATLGKMYKDGKYLKQDYSKAFDYSQKACLSNRNSGGCQTLGNMYQYGDGVKQDFVKSAFYYQKACELSDRDSCFQLGEILLNGKGIERDIRFALISYIKSCELANASACTKLGFIYENGIGVYKDLNKAKNYYYNACMRLQDGDACKEYYRMDEEEKKIEKKLLEK